MNSAYAWFDVITNIPHAILFLGCNAQMLEVKKKKTYMWSVVLLGSLIVYLNNMGYIGKMQRVLGVTFLYTIYVFFYINKKYLRAIIFCGLNYVIVIFCESISSLTLYLIFGKHTVILWQNIYVLLLVKTSFLCIYIFFKKILCHLWKMVLNRLQLSYINIYIPLIILQSIFYLTFIWKYFYDYTNIWIVIPCFLCTLISLLSDFAIFFYCRELNRKNLELLKEEYFAIQLMNHKKRMEAFRKDMDKAAEIKQMIRKDLEEAGKLLADRKGTDAGRCLTDVSQRLSRKRLYSDNLVVDSIISDKMSECQTRGYNCMTELDIPKNLPAANAELCVIFANLLDNAIRACENCPSPKIRLAARERGGYLVIRQENTFDGTVENRRQGILSEHGLGLGIVEQIAVKYQGSLKTEADEGIFVTTVLMKM